MKYIRRAVEDLVLRTDGTFKAVLLTGARQTGKTEMIKRLFPGRKYVSLDDPFIEEQACENPGMFMMLCTSRPLSSTRCSVRRACSGMSKSPVTLPGSAGSSAFPARSRWR